MSWLALGSFRLLLRLDCQQKKWVWSNPYYLLFLCSVITYWSLFRLFELVDWWNLSDDNLLHCFIFVHYRRARIVSGFPEIGELIRYLYSEINFLCADVLYNFKLFDFPGEMDLVALISSVPFVYLRIDFLDPWFIKSLWSFLCLCWSSCIQFCGPLFLQLRLPFQFWVFH